MRRLFPLRFADCPYANAALSVALYVGLLTVFLVI